MTIEAFSDYKRHDVRAALADTKPFNQIGANQDISASFTAGSTATGTWRLFVRDLAAIDVGTINAFSLVISSTH